jgi:hypothetical protein
MILAADNMVRKWLINKKAEKINGKNELQLFYYSIN